MPNEFQSTASGAGLLKSDYGDSPAYSALKKRREKLTDKIIVPSKEKVEDLQNDDSY